MRHLNWKDAIPARGIEEITRLIEVYPENWRRWCDDPENGGCNCTGCVRIHPPSTCRSNPNYQMLSGPADALTREEVARYRMWKSSTWQSPTFWEIEGIHAPWAYEHD